MKPDHVLPSTVCLSFKDKHGLKVKGWKMIPQANVIQRKGRVSVLISDKTDFKIENVTRDKNGYFIIIKGHDIRKIYEHNQEASTYNRTKGRN